MRPRTLKIFMAVYIKLCPSTKNRKWLAHVITRPKHVSSSSDGQLRCKKMGAKLMKFNALVNILPTQHHEIIAYQTLIYILRLLLPFHTINSVTAND